jgi:hypothetical protein
LSAWEILDCALGGLSFDDNLDLEAAFPTDKVTDLDAVLDGALIETRFAAGCSSIEGEAGRFFPPTAATATLFDAIGRTGRLAGLPPLIFSANIFLQTE